MAVASFRSASTWGWVLAVLALVGVAAQLLRPQRVASEAPPYRPEPVHVATVCVPQPLTGVRDAAGSPLACATCHSVVQQPLRTTVPTAFHQGLHFRHGQLACGACHDADSHYAELRLADGTRVPFADSMRLCSQCHGPQARDYAHGAHGGMRGYWDLSQGPRQRHACTVCHDPHAPAYPTLIPAPGPRDRFLDTRHEEHGHD